MKPQEKTLLTVGVIGVTLFMFAKPLSDWFKGLLGPSAGDKSYNAAQSAGNPFSPTYWRTYQKTHPKSTIIVTPANADKVVKAIHDSISYLGPDFNRIMGIFKTILYKTQVSYLAEVFQKKYGEDLLTYLRNAKSNRLIHNALTDDQINQVINFVNTLK